MQPATDFRRATLREWKQKDREDYRFFALGRKRRILGETDDYSRVISSSEIVDLANKLKDKKVTLEEFKLIKQGLIQSDENIRAFLGVTGAVNSVVRELSGHNTPFQLEAINCCCNLALGSGKAGLIVTKAAAPYLISQLDNFSHAVLDICVWTLGNLAGSGETSWSILKSQGILPKLLHLVSSGSVRQSSLYALTLYVSGGFKQLEVAEFEAIAAEVCPLLMTEPSTHWIIYLLSCSDLCDSIMLNTSMISKSLELLTKLLDDSEDSNFDSHIISMTALLRVIANIFGGNSSEGVSVLLGTDASRTTTTFMLNNLLLSSFQHIRLETLWLISNIMCAIEEPLLFLSMLEPNLSNVVKSCYNSDKTLC